MLNKLIKDQKKLFIKAQTKYKSVCNENPDFNSQSILNRGTQKSPGGIQNQVFSILPEFYLYVTLGKLLKTSFGPSCLINKVWKYHNTINLGEFL